MRAMPTWSDSQWEAITATGRNLLVSASAGAGKTAVLTERLAKRILQDGIRVDQILAMTFTDAAAAEMKTRLYRRLHQSLRDPSLTDEKRQFLEQQLTAMADANISTIHSFCLSIIKQHSYMLHVDPQSTANILSDDEMLVLKQAAFDEAVAIWTPAHNDAYQDLYDACGLPINGSDPVRDVILALANAARQAEDADQWFKTALDCYRPIRTIAEANPTLLHYFFDYWDVRQRTYRYAIEQLLHMAQLCEDVPPPFLAALQLRLDKLEPFQTAVREHNYREVRRIFRSACLTALPTVKDETLKQARKALLDDEKKVVASLFEEQDLLNGTELLQARVQALIELTTHYMEALNRRKAQRRGMDFDDMEYYACYILKQCDFRIAKQYRQRFTDILVDEFQDTSERQNQIIEWISNGNNIFRVGDVKQSIYRFRGAKPSIMQKLMEQEDDTHHVISLQHNFRSNRSIVMYNNRLFATLMNVDGLAQTYRKADEVSIGRDDQDDHSQLPVEFHALSSQKAEGSQSFASVKAHYLAQTILKMKQEGPFTHWRDYCILVRSHAVKHDLRLALEEAGIPYSMSIHSGFYRSRAISDLLQFLRYIHQPEDDIACLSVLTSSWYRTETETLALWRSEQPKASFHSILQQHKHPLVQDRIDYLVYGKQHGIWMLAQRLLMKQDYLLCHCSIQDRTNIDLYLDKLQQYERKYGSDLSSYLHYISQIEQQDSAEAIAASNEDDVIHVMTIHQSKGLQFPVVLFWSNSSGSVQDNRESVMCDETLGIGLYHLRMPQRYRIPSIARIAIQHKNTLEEAAENIRLLYVALTRAQSKLIMLDTVKETYRVPDMHLATALNQGGYSELILSGSKAITEDYCYVPCHDFIHPSTVTDQAKKTALTLPSYPKHELNQQGSIVAPSGLEKRAPLSLDLSKQRHGSTFDHGLRMHRAVELLPNETWTAAQIAALPLSLHETDIRDLLALAHDPLFQSLQDLEVHKEYSFVIREKQTLIRGYMDYLALSDTDVYVIDFKTDHGLHEEELIEHYAPQLQAYLAALRHIYPHHMLHAYLYSFFLKRMIPIR